MSKKVIRLIFVVLLVNLLFVNGCPFQSINKGVIKSSSPVTITPSVTTPTPVDENNPPTPDVSPPMSF